MTDRSDQPLTAVILAGGKGTRLRPYTTSFPKPLMPVGDRPILEILLEQLVRAGFARCHFAVGHLAELIEAYFGDGSRWGARITYLREREPLGTAGPLALLLDDLPDSFLVANGDVLSDLDFAAFLAEHRAASPERILTISTHRRIVHSEYGVLESGRDGRVVSYREKPTFPLDVSEGIYAFSRAALAWIPRERPMDFPQLVHALLQAGQTIVAREHRGLWLDIGRPEDYEQAQCLVADNPGRFAAHEDSSDIVSQYSRRGGTDGRTTGTGNPARSRSPVRHGGRP